MKENEFLVLKAVVSCKKIALDFSHSVDENIFLSSEANILAKTFINYIKNYKNKPTLKVLIDKYSKENDLINLIKAFFKKVDEGEEYDESNYAYDLEKLIKTHNTSKLNSIKEFMNTSDISDVTSTIRNIEREIGAIKATSGEKAYERKTLKNYADQFRDNYIEKVNNPEVGVGILTKYSFFDYIKNGLRPADLIIIAGETGSGKSTFMNNMAVQLYMQDNKVDTPIDQYTKGYNVTYFSLEMPYDDCFRRTISRIADVPSYSIRDGKLGKAEAKGVSKACKFMKNYPYEFDIVDVPRGFSTEQLEIMFEEIKTEYTPDVIIIDYMGLMEDVESNSDDWLKLGKLAGKIHEFARAYAIPVITAVQLNRIDPEKKKSESKSVGLHRIGRSSLIAHHATAIIQIETRIDEEIYEDFIYHIIKNRDGQLGSHSVYKNFSKCSIIDKPYDVETANAYTTNEDISADLSEIIKALG